MNSIPDVGTCKKCGGSVSLCDEEGLYLLDCQAPAACGKVELLWPSATEDLPHGLMAAWFYLGAFHAEAIARAYRGEVKEGVWDASMEMEAKALDEKLSREHLGAIWSSAIVQGVIRLARRDLDRR